MISIESMKIEHLEDVHRLSGQLGYLRDESEFKKSFQFLMNENNNALFTAIVEKKIAGWIHVAIIRNLIKEDRVEIKALIVDEGYRGQKIGKWLIEKAKEWSLQKKMNKIFLRTNIRREDAHRFYEREGFARVKTSHIYELQL